MKNPLHIAPILIVICLAALGTRAAADDLNADALLNSTFQSRTTASSIVAAFDAEIGVLFVRGNDMDNVIEVSTTKDGMVLINDGKVRIGGGPVYLKNCALIYIEGGEGQDLIVWDDTSANGDGDVDGWDFLVWQRGGSASPSTGSGDYALWQSHYGTSACVLPEGEGLFIRTNDEEYDFLMPIEIRELTIKVAVEGSK